MMKIQNIPLFIIIFSFQFIYSQNQTNGASQPPGPIINTPSLNNQFGNFEIPSTPDAYGLGTYGNLGVNNGVLNFQIPIYTIKMGNYTLPIYLSYSYTGLKVEEEAGIAGLGWSLHAGGLVQRELRGVYQDESPLGGYVRANVGINYVIPFINNTIPYDSIKVQVLGMSAGQTTEDLGKGDTEPDKFNINMEGLSGSFSHNEYGIPVYYEKKNYYIEDQMESTSYIDSILVTDDNGIKYFFTDIVETTGEVQGDIENYNITYSSEWWISKIQNSIDRSKNIHFEYYNNINGVPPYYTKEAYVEYKRVAEGVNCNILGSICHSIQQQSPFNSYSNTFTANRKIIKTIYFDEGKVEFEVRNDSQIYNTPRYYLNSIKIYRKLIDNTYFSQPFLSYFFEYDNTTSKYRILKKITKKDKNGVAEPYYHMEYFHENVLDSLGNLNNNNFIQLAKSQDWWGYYNGKDNNTLLFGDRSPDFDNTLIGSLHKIYFPTSGYTQINYEANDIYREIDSCGVNPMYLSYKVNLKSYQQYYNWLSHYNTPNNDSIIKVYDTVWPNSLNYQNNPITDTIGYTTSIYRDTIHISYTSNFEVEFKNILTETNGCRVKSKISFSQPVTYLCGFQNSLSLDAFQINSYDDTELISTTISMSTATNFDPTYDTDENDGTTESTEPTYDYTVYAYQRTASTLIEVPENTDIYIEIDTQTFLLQSESYAEGEITLKSFSYPEINHKVGGIRIASTIDCPNDSLQPCVETNYNYNNELGQSTGKVIKTNNYNTITYYTVYGTGANPQIDAQWDNCSCSYKTTSARSKIPLMTPNGSNIFYQKVTKTINDGHKTGRQIFEYDTLFNNVFPNELSYIHTLNDNQWKYGGLIKKINEKYINNDTYELKSQTNYDYDINEVYSYSQLQQHHMYAFGLSAMQIKHYYVNGIEKTPNFGSFIYITYDNTPEQKLLKSKKSTQYFYADSLTAFTQYEYDNLTGNLKQQTYEDSKSDEYKIRYYYPNDITNVNSLDNIPLTQDELHAYNLMKAPDATHPDNLNLVSTPVQIEKNYLKNNEIIHRQRITFHHFDTIAGTNDAPLVLPHKIWEEKGDNDLEVKKVISAYDDWGNPVEVYQPDGTYTYNVWGYNHSKLIAQIINLKVADVTGVIAGLIQTAIDASDDDAGSSSIIENYQNEKVLRQALNDLQTSLPPETQMTYYTYDPLVGVTSITDPKGETRLYVYDNFNRLIRIMLDDATTDDEGKPQNDNTILKEFEYHYKE